MSILSCGQMAGKLLQRPTLTARERESVTALLEKMLGRAGGSQQLSWPQSARIMRLYEKYFPNDHIEPPPPWRTGITSGVSEPGKEAPWPL